MNRVGCFFVGLWFGAATAGAADADPQSNACQQALAALQARESELAAGAQTPPRTPTDARWQALRASAARACLGRESTAPVPPPRSALPPIAVPPVTPPAAAEVPPRRTPAPLPPPVPTSKPPVFVMSCDALGCWTSDGARLPHVGRNPLDARVRCSVRGQLVMCF